jgi:hypothetical protein
MLLFTNMSFKGEIDFIVIVRSRKEDKMEKAGDSDGRSGKIDEMKAIARAKFGNVIYLMACRCFGVGGRFVCELERLYIYIYLLSCSALVREGRFERGSNLMRR